jgi:hypothetical protein
MTSVYKKYMHHEHILELLDTFIVTEHENRYSPGWNNDKLLVLIKK